VLSEWEQRFARTATCVLTFGSFRRRRERGGSDLCTDVGSAAAIPELSVFLCHRLATSTAHRQRNANSFCGAFVDADGHPDGPTERYSDPDEYSNGCDGYGYGDRSAHLNSHRNTFRNSHGGADRNPDAEPHRDEYGNAHANGERDGNGNADCHGNPDTNSDRDGNRNPDGNADRNCNSDGNRDSDRDAD
jgi:hypothetical protein